MIGRNNAPKLVSGTSIYGCVRCRILVGCITDFQIPTKRMFTIPRQSTPHWFPIHLVSIILLEGFLEKKPCSGLFHVSRTQGVRYIDSFEHPLCETSILVLYTHVCLLLYSYYDNNNFFSCLEKEVTQENMGDTSQLD